MLFEDQLLDKIHHLSSRSRARHAFILDRLESITILAAVLAIQLSHFLFHITAKREFEAVHLVVRTEYPKEFLEHVVTDHLSRVFVRSAEIDELDARTFTFSIVKDKDVTEMRVAVSAMMLREYADTLDYLQEGAIESRLEAFFGFILGNPLQEWAVRKYFQQPLLPCRHKF